VSEITPKSLMIVGGSRRRGRPPLSLDGPSTDVCVAIAGSEYDQLYAIATKEDVSVPELMRRGARLLLSHPTFSDTK
jgi:hypothetical protein